MGKVLTKLRDKIKAENELAARFPFEDLPDVCKLHVFSFLSTEDKVAASRVCREWRQLVHSPKLWTRVDIPASVRRCRRAQRCLVRCEPPAHHTRISKFLEFVARVNPAVQRFVFVGDIADSVYHDMLRRFVDDMKLSDLRDVNIDWTRSPTSSDLAGPSGSPGGRIDEHHRRRQRLFVRFLENFSSIAQNVESLALPFDWSAKSVDAIVRLRKLESLSLSRYSELQPLEGATLDRLLAGLPNLRSLTLEVWIPCAAGGLSFYSIRSNSLETVDMSLCRGFAIREVHLPRVKVFRVSRQPWSGPLVMRSDDVMLPCLHHVLREGAPNLTWLNDHQLHGDWCENLYEELDAVLKDICPCELHCSCLALQEHCV